MGLSVLPNITLSSDATGSGTTSIVVTLANTAVTANTYGNATHIPSITVNSKGLITGVTLNAASATPSLIDGGEF